VTIGPGTAGGSAGGIDAAEWQRVRRLVPEVLGALVRRHGHFDACEDAVQEALVAASTQWPEQGRPDSAKAWLLTVASRRLLNRLRSDEARRRREEADAARTPATPPEPQPVTGDDTLTLLFLCCHPALSAPAQAALTLRAVAGLTTAEIARAYLVPEATMAQRISRAKQRIRATGASFRLPPDAERSDRLRVVLQVLYLLFNEGYTATAGSHLVRPDLTAEAVRLARDLLRLVPDDGEVAGLLALMLLTDARRPARTDGDGALVPLAEQDRSLWDADAIAEGTALVTGSLATKPVGPYQLQAAIAAVHDEAATAGATDWPQILALYGLLERVAPGPMVTLNRAVAEAMVHGPAAGLDLLADLAVDDRVSGAHRVDSVRAHLLEMAGDAGAAHDAYLLAARRTTSTPEQRHLLARAERVRASAPPPRRSG
jgi:RNA polymerase sigma factor (sigma-70 family)